MPVKIGDEQWYTIQDCAIEKGVSYDAMQAYVKRHRSEFKTVSIGKNVLFRLVDLAGYKRREPRRRK